MKLKKLTLILLLILPIFIVGCKNKTTTISSKKGNNVITNAQDIKSQMNMSPLELVKLGKTFKCTFTSEDETGAYTVKGTTYVDKDKMFSETVMEFNIEAEGYEQEDIEMSTLMTDGMYYMWGTNTTSDGMKMAVKDIEEQAEKSDEEQSQYAKQMNQKIEYNCDKWVAKPSMFKVPENVTFTDMDEMMEEAVQMQKDSEEMLKSMCGTCDMMPDEAAKQDCLVNLGCE